MSKKTVRNIDLTELSYQLLLHIILFVIYSYDRHHEEFLLDQSMFFIQYAFAAFLINYMLLPALYYKKKYIPFFLSLIVVIILVIVCEELVLEKIFYANTRGQSFPGVISSLFDILPTIAILVGFKFAWDAHKKQREVDALQQSVKESELAFLKLQINPHFLFNNLNNLYAYAIENSPKTPSIILELSSVLRYMLYDCKEDFVSLSKEITHLENFTRLNELQIEERGIVQFVKKGNLDNYQIAPLILVVFIENAFKHSTASQSEGIRISVSVTISPNGILHFSCINTFLPVSNTESLSKGIGMENVKKRLHLLYPNKHTLQIDETETEYSVQLELKLKTSVV